MLRGWFGWWKVGEMKRQIVFAVMLLVALSLAWYHGRKSVDQEVYLTVNYPMPVMQFQTNPAWTNVVPMLFTNSARTQTVSVTMIGYELETNQ
jgi:hypothetical protein